MKWAELKKYEFVFGSKSRLTAFFTFLANQDSTARVKKWNLNLEKLKKEKFWIEILRKEVKSVVLEKRLFENRGWPILKAFLPIFYYHEPNAGNQFSVSKLIIFQR